MRYNKTITLAKNGRGCYILDTVKGCSYAQKQKGGCYGSCYAENIARRYLYDFKNPVIRGFDRDDLQIYFDGFLDTKHESQIIKQIKNIDMPFVRIGEMGDPSENWEHTVNVVESIRLAGKKIVIITKHLNKISEHLLCNLSGICINTSISAMDSPPEIKYRLEQYNRLKPYCNSVLRVVSCDFNTKTTEGSRLNDVQNMLLDNECVIETVFRPNQNNKLMTESIINTEKARFLKSDVIASVRDSALFFGHCSACPDMCGVNYFD